MGQQLQGNGMGQHGGRARQWRWAESAGHQDSVAVAFVKQPPWQQVRVVEVLEGGASGGPGVAQEGISGNGAGQQGSNVEGEQLPEKGALLWSLTAVAGWGVVASCQECALGGTAAAGGGVQQGSSGGLAQWGGSGEDVRTSRAGAAHVGG